MVNPSKSPLLIVLSAPSGGGKTTVCQALLRSVPNLTRAVTCTTRAPRPGEIEGVDYFFLAESRFLAEVRRGGLLESAVVYGHHYGTFRHEVLDKLNQGRDVLLSVDVQGATSIRHQTAADPLLKSAWVSVFLAPHSLAVLQQRLEKRGQDSPEVMQRRLSVAREEIAQRHQFDYLIISGTIADDLERMQTIIAAERLRTHRSRAEIQL